MSNKPGRPPGTGLGGRTRAFSPAELDQFLQAAKRVGKREDLMMSLTYFFGLRVSELVELRKADINPAIRSIVIRGKKHGLTKDYPLPERLWKKYLSYIRERGEDQNPWLFRHRLYPETEHLTREGAMSTFERVLQASGVQGPHSIHDLRHSCAMDMARRGDSLYQIASWMRHRSLLSSMRYIDHQNDQVHAATMAQRASEVFR